MGRWRSFVAAIAVLTSSFAAKAAPTDHFTVTDLGPESQPPPPLFTEDFDALSSGQPDVIFGGIDPSVWRLIDSSEGSPSAVVRSIVLDDPKAWVGKWFEQLEPGLYAATLHSGKGLGVRPRARHAVLSLTLPKVTTYEPGIWIQYRAYLSNSGGLSRLTLRVEPEDAAGAYPSQQLPSGSLVFEPADSTPGAFAATRSVFVTPTACRDDPQRLCWPRSISWEYEASTDAGYFVLDDVVVSQSRPLSILITRIVGDESIRDYLQHALETSLKNQGYEVVTCEEDVEEVSAAEKHVTARHIASLEDSGDMGVILTSLSQHKCRLSPGARLYSARLAVSSDPHIGRRELILSLRNLEDPRRSPEPVWLGVSDDQKTSWGELTDSAVRHLWRVSPFEIWVETTPESRDVMKIDVPSSTTNDMLGDSTAGWALYWCRNGHMCIESAEAFQALQQSWRECVRRRAVYPTSTVAAINIQCDLLRDSDGRFADTWVHSQNWPRLIVDATGVPLVRPMKSAEEVAALPAEYRSDREVRIRKSGQFVVLAVGLDGRGRVATDVSSMEFGTFVPVASKVALGVGSWRGEANFAAEMEIAATVTRWLNLGAGSVLQAGEKGFGALAGPAAEAWLESTDWDGVGFSLSVIPGFHWLNGERAVAAIGATAGVQYRLTENRMRPGQNWVVYASGGVEVIDDVPNVGHLTLGAFGTMGVGQRIDW